MSIYIINSEKVRNVLNEFVDEFDTIRSASEFLNTRENNLQRWLRGERSIPLEVIDFILDRKNIPLTKFLDSERIKSWTSNNTFKISNNISEYECQILGWILTDGHIGIEKPTIISQKSKTTLKNLRSILKTVFDFENLPIYPDRDNWKLQIPSIAFSEYLKSRYNMPGGKKDEIIEVPEIIFSLSREHKLAFLTGCIEGDGSFTTFLRRSTSKGIYRVPRIVFGSNSINFLKGIQRLLIGIDINSTLNHDHDKKYKLTVSKLEDCSKLLFWMYPFMISKEKIADLTNSFSEKQVLNILRINNARQLIQEWKNKLGSWGAIKKIMEEKYKHSVSLLTISYMGRSSNRAPLSAVIEACKTLDKNILDHIPVYYASVLWLFQFIPKNKFEELRIKETKTGKENLVNMDKIRSSI